MQIYSLYIINKSGGLIYEFDFAPGVRKLTSNDYLVLAGTMHSVHALSSQVSPTGKSSGIRSVETGHFAMYVKQTLTGMKFIVVTAPVGIGNLGIVNSGVVNASLSVSEKNQKLADEALAKIYVIYSDYVLKNPFYQLEMPIRSELFDAQLESFVRKFSLR